VGALFVREGVAFPSFIKGASQEGGRRAGTESVPLVVALGEACELAGKVLPEEILRVRELREVLHKGLQEAVRGLELNGHPEQRLPNTLNVSFRGIAGPLLLQELGEVCASVGSACHEGTGEISPVLRAMGVPEEVAMGAVRFSLGRWTAKEEVDQALEAVRNWASRRRKGLRGWFSRILKRS
jgi:cysteine desulfurase